tara:strand:+ start:465 stop:617 length:153 start_codon:yes stop_codon:yes gene_type:complete
MTDIAKTMDLTYLRGQVVALYKLTANLQKQINDLEEEIKDGENARRKTEE